MPSIYVISRYVAYQNSVRLVEFMPFTTAFHPSLYNSCLIVNPWARLMLIIVKTMFIERKKKKNKQSRFPWFTQAETSRPCAERISTPSTLTELTAFLKKKKKKGDEFRQQTPCEYSEPRYQCFPFTPPSTPP